MSKTLVAYFSASGTTRYVAKIIAEITKSDLYEIEPQVAYSNKDLDWTDNKSRSSIEMNNKSLRPEIKDNPLDVSSYDTIYLGFPIWWYVAPTIINTFLEKYNFSNKHIILFATSGGSGFGNIVSELQDLAPNVTFTNGKVFHYVNKQDIMDWLDSLK